MGKLREGAAERLILYARHLGWLHATPEVKGGERKSAPVSRMTTLRNKAALGAEVAGLDMPPLGGLDYLINHFLEVGPAQAGETLTFTEIASWRAQTGVELNAWEVVMLRRMSAAYLGEHHEAKDPQRKAPSLPAEDDES